MNEAELLKKILQKRKSTFPRDYKETPISPKIIEEIIASAESTPNHKKTKPWRLKLFKGEEKNLLGKELQAIYKATTSEALFLEKKYIDIASKINKTDAIVTIVVNYSGLVPEWEEVAATSMAVQNMYLTCAVNGIGCYWSSPKIVNELKESLVIKENQQCLGLFYMGNID